MPEVIPMMVWDGDGLHRDVYARWCKHHNNFSLCRAQISIHASINQRYPHLAHLTGCSSIHWMVSKDPTLTLPVTSATPCPCTAVARMSAYVYALANRRCSLYLAVAATSAAPPGSFARILASLSLFIHRTLHSTNTKHLDLRQDVLNDDDDNDINTQPTSRQQVQVEPQPQETIQYVPDLALSHTCPPHVACRRSPGTHRCSALSQT